jgi:hypothetical protein
MRRIDTMAMVLALSGSACTTGESAEPTQVPITGGAPVVQVIAGAPADSAPVDRVVITTESAPTALSVMGGVVAVATAGGVLAGSLDGDAVVAVPVIAAEEGEPTSTGAAIGFARRDEGGLLVLAESGLFHDNAGVLLSSPLGASLEGKTLRAIDALGAGAAEELWLTTDQGSYHVAAGALVSFAVAGAAAPPDATVGVAAGQAVVAVGGVVYLVDVAALTASPIAEGLGAVLGSDRGEDGTVYLATEAGLLSRTRAGAVALRTFAPVGAPADAAIAITASFGGVFAVTGQGLLAIELDSSRKIGAVAPGVRQGAAVDANADLWIVEGTSLYRYKTGAPVSFAEDVEPFLRDHCSGCHAAGTTDAPDHDFEDYATATEWAPVLVSRLKASGPTTMPPPNTEVLTAAEYSVVTRWVAGGMAP